MTVYYVWSEDQTSEDALEIEANSASFAVERWAQQEDINSAEYSIANGNKATVFVRRQGDADYYKYVAMGETIPSYYARRVD